MPTDVDEALRFLPQALRFNTSQTDTVSAPSCGYNATSNDARLKKAGAVAGTA
jgi:hypothetical protein